MRRHDSIFKKLLCEFFPDLLRLVVPEVATGLDLERPVLLDKEFFTIEGRRRELDLLARFSATKGDDETLLVHVEVEARARREMERRLWRYRNKILSVHDSLILSVVMYLTRGLKGVQIRTLESALLSPNLVNFGYVVFGLAGCDPAEYLDRPEPLAWGLAALMRGGTLNRPRLKLACLRRIASADLGEERRLLLVNCVESYLELKPEEAAEYATLCAVQENREVRAMATSWADRLEAKGREEGLQKGMHEGLRAMREVLLSQLEQRFGPLPETIRERVESISSLNRLTRLGRRVLTARSLASLRLG